MMIINENMTNNNNCVYPEILSRIKIFSGGNHSTDDQRLAGRPVCKLMDDMLFLFFRDLCCTYVVAPFNKNIKTHERLL